MSECVVGRPSTGPRGSGCACPQSCGRQRWLPPGGVCLRQPAGCNSPGALLSDSVVSDSATPRAAWLPSLDSEGWGLLEPQIHDLGRAPSMGGLGEDRTPRREGELLWPSHGAGPVRGLEDRPGPRRSPCSLEFLDWPGGCWPGPHSGGPSSHSRHWQPQPPRRLCPGCVTAMWLQRGPLPSAQLPLPRVYLVPGETSCASCAPVPSKRAKQGGGRGGDRAIEKEKAFFAFAHTLERFRQMALCGIHREMLQPREGRDVGPVLSDAGRGLRVSVCVKFHCEQRN